MVFLFASAATRKPLIHFPWSVCRRINRPSRYLSLSKLTFASGTGASQLIISLLFISP